MTKTLIISSETLGSGSIELGQQLMGSFLRKLWSQQPKPRTIVFYNSAVRLLADGSGVLEALDGLSEAGVDLIACGTCVAYFDLKDKIVVGRVSDMNEITSVIIGSGPVATV